MTITLGEYVSNSVVARVARGASILDRLIGGWAERIDLDIFDIADYNACILGQLYRDERDQYTSGLDAVADASGVERHAAAIRLGFDNESAVGYSDLQRAWEAEIAARV